jgi:hypothetical protein
MSALTQDTSRLKKGQFLLQTYGVAGSAVIFYGAGVCVDADGDLVRASDTAGLTTVGIAEQAADNTGGADGDLTVRVYRGAVKFTGSGITQANVGEYAVWLDDNTVGLPGAATNDIEAGEILEVESDGVWVHVIGAADHVALAAALAAIATLQTDLNTAEAAIAALDVRVTALEAP